MEGTKARSLNVVAEFRNLRHPARTSGVRIGLRCLSTVVALVFALHGRSEAQDASADPDYQYFVPTEPGEARLTVHPPAMATGVQNPAAGEYTLDSASDAIVVVPPQCVGTHRCPLLVQLPGGGTMARELVTWVGPAAAKYGFILLVKADGRYTPKHLDAALKETLHRFAVDPAKLAIVGRCGSGPAGLRYGIDNPDVFSRAAVLSPSYGALNELTVAGMDSTNKTTQFLFDQGIQELDWPDNLLRGGVAMFNAAWGLRTGGHPVTVMLAIRSHGHQVEDYDYVGHWLQQTWGLPGPQSRPMREFPAKSLPLLTTKALEQLTAFWTHFAAEPDSVWIDARQKYLGEIVVPFGQESPFVRMTDMPAFAARYPVVAADLRQAGLTAEQHDAYRAALVSAQIGYTATPEAIGTIPPGSILAKNIEFLDAHPDELKALDDVKGHRKYLDGSEGEPAIFWYTP